MVVGIPVEVEISVIVNQMREREREMCTKRLNCKSTFAIAGVDIKKAGKGLSN